MSTENPRRASARSEQQTEAAQPAERVRRFRTHHFPEAIERRLKALSHINSAHALLALAEDLSLLLAGMAAVRIGLSNAGDGWGVALCLVGWLVIGARMRGLATLLHESAHKALARPLWLNALIGSVAGWAILQLRSAYVQSHIGEHHRYLGDPDRDPDTRQYVMLKLLDADPQHMVRRNLVQLLLGLKTFVNLPYLLRDRLVPRSGVHLTPWELAELAGFLAAWTALLAVCAATGHLDTLLYLWIIPYLTTFQAINWLIEVSEHFPLIWTCKDPFHHTRNRKGPAIERFFTGCHGENWHRVHHERPGIPFWNLKAAHAAMMEDPEYAATEAETGGLFLRGANGEPSIVSAIKTDLMRLRAARTGKEARA